MKSLQILRSGSDCMRSLSGLVGEWLHRGQNAAIVSSGTDIPLSPTTLTHPTHTPQNRPRPASTSCKTLGTGCTTRRPTGLHGRALVHLPRGSQATPVLQAPRSAAECSARIARPGLHSAALDLRVVVDVPSASVHVDPPPPHFPAPHWMRNVHRRVAHSSGRPRDKLWADWGPEQRGGLRAVWNGM